MAAAVLALGSNAAAEGALSSACEAAEVFSFASEPSSQPFPGHKHPGQQQTGQQHSGTHDDSQQQATDNNSYLAVKAQLCTEYADRCARFFTPREVANL